MEQVIETRRELTNAELEEAFIRLIKEKGFHSVTVKDIVETAGYNRSTFYLYYHDKYDLAEQLLRSKTNGLKSAVGKPYEPGQKVMIEDFDSGFMKIIDYIYEQRDFFLLLNYKDTIPGIYTEIPRAISKIYNDQFEFETINHREVNRDFFNTYHSHGFYGLINQWIKEEFQTPKPKFIQEFVNLTKTLISSFEYVGE